MSKLDLDAIEADLSNNAAYANRGRHVYALVAEVRRLREELHAALGAHTTAATGEDHRMSALDILVHDRDEWKARALVAERLGSENAKLRAVADAARELRGCIGTWLEQGHLGVLNAALAALDRKDG